MNQVNSLPTVSVDHGDNFFNGRSSAQSGDALFLSYQLRAIQAVCIYPVYVLKERGCTKFIIQPGKRVSLESEQSNTELSDSADMPPVYDPLKHAPLFESDKNGQTGNVVQPHSPDHYVIWFEDNTPHGRAGSGIPDAAKTLWELDPQELNHCINITEQILSYEFPSIVDGAQEKNTAMRAWQAMHQAQRMYGWNSDQFVTAAEATPEPSSAGDVGQFMESLQERALRLQDVFLTVLRILSSPQNNPYRRSGQTQSQPQASSVNNQVGGVRKRVHTKWTCLQLRTHAKELGLKGLTRMTKPMLVKSIAAWKRSKSRSHR